MSSVQLPIHDQYQIAITDLYFDNKVEGIIRKMTKAHRIQFALECIESGQKVYFAMSRLPDTSPFELNIAESVKEHLKAKGHTVHEEDIFDKGWSADACGHPMYGLVETIQESLNGKDLWIER